jgi:hypothetical protein
MDQEPMKKFTVTFAHKSGNAEFETTIECVLTWFALKEAVDHKMNFLGLDPAGWTITSLKLQ